ncbi:hypothetical protein HDF26_003704 [Pedobacter cryoconitis]|uniref:Outer membrane protein beta-barrel domain-containing protein n=1 Tax=Pedobacter cryoconitis TaxID=188932 RepID=A0A7W9DY51_9SPHI|nr:porin family protein [Pedobacter cryoconitis]MBB5635857.1 hypothetical protein [Pedobacter cryoconitis]MBB6273244.1 hypothetical protein [Pedobacter cryoconitis]
MKQIVTGLLLTFLTTAAFAQQGQETYYGFRLGLTAHPTFGWAKPEGGKGNGFSLGFSYGLLADLNFAENYSLATGLTITTINGKTSEINPSPFYNAAVYPGNTLYDLKYKMQYLEVPLTLKLKTDKIGDVRWYGQFGLSNGFNIGARQDVSVAGKSIVSDESIKKNTNFYRAGLIVGAGLEYDVAKHTSVTTGLTLNNGFTDISSASGRNVRNHYIGLNIGVFF